MAPDICRRPEPPVPTNSSEGVVVAEMWLCHPPPSSSCPRPLPPILPHREVCAIHQANCGHGQGGVGWCRHCEATSPLVRRYFEALYLLFYYSYKLPTQLASGSAQINSHWKTALEARSLKPGCGQGHARPDGAKEGYSCLFQLWGSRCSWLGATLP